MTVALKKAEAAPKVGIRKPASASARVVSEVDMLIVRLKKIRKGQKGGIDIRQAIDDGRA